MSSPPPNYHSFIHSLAHSCTLSAYLDLIGDPSFRSSPSASQHDVSAAELSDHIDRRLALGHDGRLLLARGRENSHDRKQKLIKLDVDIIDETRWIGRLIAICNVNAQIALFPLNLFDWVLSSGCSYRLCHRFCFSWFFGIFANFRGFSDEQGVRVVEARRRDHGRRIDVEIRVSGERREELQEKIGRWNFRN